MAADEIFALKGQDVHLGNGEVHVFQSRNHAKTSTAYMTSTVHSMLKDLSIDPGRPVFPSRNGGTIREASATLIRSVDARDYNEGVDDSSTRVVFHSLRQVFRSWLAQAPVSLHDIVKFISHTG